MDALLLTAVLAGLGGMFGWGLADLFAKKTIDEIGDVSSLVIAHIFGTLALGLWALYAYMQTGSLPLPTTSDAWAGIAFYGVLQGIVYLLVYRGFGKGQVAVLNPVFASFSGIAAIISILFLGEFVDGQTVAALFVIFLGVMLISIDPTAIRERRFNLANVAGFKEIALATVLAAFWTLGWDGFVSGENWLSYAALMYVFMTIALLCYAWVRKIKLEVGKPWVWKYLVLIGIFETGAYVAISWGYSVTTFTSVVAVLSGAFSLPTIFLARVFLKEQTTRLQFIASLVIVAGIILLSVL